MGDLQADIEVLYARFLTAWNARDFAGVADCFSQPATYVLPGADVTVADRAAMIALLEKVFAGLEADGFDRTEVGPITARACGADLAIVDAKSVARRRGDGSAIEVIDGHYVARRSDGIWRLSVAVTCAQGWEAA